MSTGFWQIKEQFKGCVAWQLEDFKHDLVFSSS